MARRYRYAVLLAAVVAGGCSTPLEPGDSLSTRSAIRPTATALEPETDPLTDGRHFYPLDLGNRWQYARRFTTQFFPQGLPPRTLLDVDSHVERVLACLEDLYTIETSTEVIATDQGPLTTQTWARYRQDGDGLFQKDVPQDLPPICIGETVVERLSRGKLLTQLLEARTGVPNDPSMESELSRVERCVAFARGITVEAIADEGIANALAGESTILAYPLHPLRTWNITPSAIAWVEAIDILELAGHRFVAQRVRIHIAGFMGPQDRLTSWVSRSGFLKLEARFVRPIILNRELGLLLTLESEVLESLELVSGLP